MEQWTSRGVKKSGKIGLDSAASGRSARHSQVAASSNKLRCSERLLSGSGVATMDSAVKSLHSQLTRQSAPLAGPSNWLDTETQPRSMADASASFASVASSKHPPPKPQLAVPVCVIEHLKIRAEAGWRTRYTHAVADLATITFFFLIRVGEYTIPARNHVTRTVQFRVWDVKFYRAGVIIPNTSPVSHKDPKERTDARRAQATTNDGKGGQQ